MKDKKIHISYENLEEYIEILINTVLESEAFKKLEGKTQIIFTDGPIEQVRNRGSHTMEVAEISERLAKKYGNVNPRLAYFIGLCHDLGHTAFGHDGESRINLACQEYSLDTAEFDQKFAGIELDDSEFIYEKPEYSFEHHAHSVRVLRKILEECDIVLDKNLRDDIMHGILCHSTSRTKDEEVKKPVWAIARFADKIYPYTDMTDILSLDLPFEITPDILDDINNCRDGEYITNDDTKEKIPFTEADKEILKEVIAKLKEQGGLERYMEKYIDGATLQEVEVQDKLADGTMATAKSYNYVASKEMKREMKILKTLAKYLRQEKLMGKKELEARAIIDEVLEYIIQKGISDGLEPKEACYRASIIVAQSTDKEMRELFAKISKDPEWQKTAGKRIAPNDFKDKSVKERSENYPIRLTAEERSEIFEDPKKMVQRVRGEDR